MEELYGQSHFELPLVVIQDVEGALFQEVLDGALDGDIRPSPPAQCGPLHSVGVALCWHECASSAAVAVDDESAEPSPSNYLREKRSCLPVAGRWVGGFLGGKQR